jgi:uncharacterized protein
MTSQYPLFDLMQILGSVDGRKKLQKIVYILKSIGFPFQEDFRYHYFGPYSSDVQYEISELVDEKYVEESHEGAVNGYESYSYHYIGDESQSNQFSQYSEFLLQLNGKEARLLEMVSTIFFLEADHYGSPELIRQKVISLKPHLEGLVDQAFEYHGELLQKQFLPN